MSTQLRLVATASLCLAVAACASGSRPASSPPKPVSVAPLTTTLTTSAATWALVPMGHLDDPANTFWQVFVLPKGRRSWALVTPPGVADNGGLVAANQGNGTVVIGFRPSQSLNFSPLATTTDSGMSYTPDLITAALADLPDALATAPSGQAAALVDGGTRLLLRTGSAGPWRETTTQAALARSPSGRACGVQQITAVAQSSTGTYLGLACSRSGTVGLMRLTAAGVQPVELDLPASTATTQVEVLRLVAASGGLTAVLRLTAPGSTTYRVAWTSTQHPAWSLSAPLSDDETLMSTAVADGAVGLLTGIPGTAVHINLIRLADLGWTVLPNPPPATTSIAISGARVDALVAATATLTDYTLNQVTDQWDSTQVINVTLPFGSSG